jgi:periplasmic divalent cation tolerance protein
VTTNVRVVMVTAPDEETAVSLARDLLESRLAACVNVVPGVRSLYRWEGKIAHEGEVLMVIKSTDHALAALVERVQARHPYEVPEVLVVEVTGGASRYIDWVRSETGDPGPEERNR